MALAGMASRFAVLPDDDTTDWVAPKSKKGNNNDRFMIEYFWSVDLYKRVKVLSCDSSVNLD